MGKPLTFRPNFSTERFLATVQDKTKEINNAIEYWMERDSHIHTSSVTIIDADEAKFPTVPEIVQKIKNKLEG